MDLSQHINAIIIGVMPIPLKREHSWWVVPLLMAGGPVLAF
jgi:hypothetical protein